jgi:hypothetical protein
MDKKFGRPQRGSERLWRILVGTRIGLDVLEKKKLLVSARNIMPIL